MKIDFLVRLPEVRSREIFRQSIYQARRMPKTHDGTNGQEPRSAVVDVVKAVEMRIVMVAEMEGCRAFGILIGVIVQGQTAASSMPLWICRRAGNFAWIKQKTSVCAEVAANRGHR